MKAIEQGCMAIIIDGHVKSNIGNVVQVGKFIGGKDRHGANDLWEVDKLIDFVNFFGQIVQFRLCSEKTMQRIDDEDINQEIDITKEVEALTDY